MGYQTGVGFQSWDRTPDKGWGFRQMMMGHQMGDDGIPDMGWDTRCMCGSRHGDDWVPDRDGGVQIRDGLPDAGGVSNIG